MQLTKQQNKLVDDALALINALGTVGAMKWAVGNAAAMAEDAAESAAHPVDERKAPFGPVDLNRLKELAETQPDSFDLKASGILKLINEIERLRGMLERERALAQAQADKRDAERYRWIRRQNWNESALSVVAKPKDAVKLGHDCPSMERLDAAIDAALQQTKEGQ